MSKFVKVRTELRDLALVKQALGDLKIEHEEEAVYRHAFGGFTGKVPLLVKTGRVQFGLRQMPDGDYEVIGDDMQMRQIRGVLDALRQRYAYRKVLSEVSEAGFDLVEEQQGRDGVIRMTVRRWS